jgi:hypothetical protein
VREDDDRLRRLDQGKDDVREMAASGRPLLKGCHVEARTTGRGTRHGVRHDHGMGTRSEVTHRLPKKISLAHVLGRQLHSAASGARPPNIIKATTIINN